MLNFLSDIFDNIKKITTPVLVSLLVFDWWALLFKHSAFSFIDADPNKMQSLGEFYLFVFRPSSLIVVFLGTVGLIHIVWRKTRNNYITSKIMSAFLVTYISKIGLIAFNLFLLSGNLKYICGWSAVGTQFILGISTVLNFSFFIISLISDNVKEQS